MPALRQSCLTSSHHFPVWIVLCITKLEFPHPLPTAKERRIMFRRNYRTHSSLALVFRCIHSTSWCYPALLVFSPTPPPLFFVFGVPANAKCVVFLPLSRARIIHVCITLDTCATGSDLRWAASNAPSPCAPPPRAVALNFIKQRGD